MKIRSLQSARSVPPPTHQPCTCAITGFGLSQIDMYARTLRDMLDVVAHGIPLPGHRPLRRIFGLRPPGEVVAGAERPPGAAEHEHLHVAVVVRRGDGAAQVSDELPVDRVQPLRPVQHEPRDAVGGAVVDGFEASCVSPSMLLRKPCDARHPSDLVDPTAGAQLPPCAASQYTAVSLFATRAMQTRTLCHNMKHLQDTSAAIAPHRASVAIRTGRREEIF